MTGIVPSAGDTVCMCACVHEFIYTKDGRKWLRQGLENLQKLGMFVTEIQEGMNAK